MPTTRPRRVRLKGVEVALTVDRPVAERIKSMPPYRWLGPGKAARPLTDGEPDINGTGMDAIDWYHTIDLPGGVVTPGFVDHRAQVDLYGLPESLAGKRCLDVATFDGFWAFEMEKRGAAEVIGIDVHSLADCDVPENWREEYLKARPNEIKGAGFAYAKRALGSKVRRHVLSVYELSPERIGTFDFVFMSDLLLHLRDPLRALERLWTVTRGEAIIADTYDKELEATAPLNSMRVLLGMDDYSGCFWWNFTPGAIEVLLRVARFTDVEKVAQLDLDTRLGVVVPKVVFRAKGGR